MSWSYSEFDLGTDSEDGRMNVVRLLVGDTNEDDPLVEDEEIFFALAQNSDQVYLAAAWIARSLAAKFARKVTTQLDGALRANYSDLSKQFSKLSDNLEYQGKRAGSVVGIKAGGISKVAVNSVRANTDRIGSYFRRDKFRNPPSYDDDSYDTDY